MKNRLIIRHANLFTPQGKKEVRGENMGDILHIENATIVADGGIITYVGDDENQLPLCEGSCEIREIDAQGKAVIPGFVDSHTHLIFGGYRPEEFGWRLKGDTYMSIMERGGGIQSTVDATRTAGFDELVQKGAYYIEEMAKMGVTTVEAKSGYGLDVATEMKMLSVIAELQHTSRIDIVSTFLGAHAVPKEYKGRTNEYIDLMINDMLPQASDYAEFFDIFTEKGVFELEESRRLLEAAKHQGFKLKMHADEIFPLGGAELAAEMGCVSADHLLHITESGVEALSRGGVVATLLPLTAFALKEGYAPARKLIEANCAVALATDLNPGSCFSGSIPLTIALACIYMNMSVEETLTALTLNGAAAVDRAHSVGSIEVGKKADFNILKFESIASLPYYVGMNCVERTIKNGETSKCLD